MNQKNPDSLPSNGISTKGRIQMYRAHWVHGIFGKRTVLNVALDVHMTATGAFERSISEQEQDIRALKHTLDNWKSPVSGFDYCCRKLIEEALYEHEISEWRRDLREREEG